MNLKAHITGKAKSVEHPGQIVDIDRDLDGDGIVCFALRNVSADMTALGAAVVGEFSIRDLSYILGTLKKEFGDKKFKAALFRALIAEALDETSVRQEMQQ